MSRFRNPKQEIGITMTNSMSLTKAAKNWNKNAEILHMFLP